MYRHSVLLFACIGVLAIVANLAGHISNDTFLLAALFFIGVVLLWVTLLEKLS